MAKILLTNKTAFPILNPTKRKFLSNDFKHNCVWALRSGLFYDPAPAEGSPDDYYGFSLGGGIAYKGIVFDLAYQFRSGNDVGGSILEGLGFSQDVQEHTIYSSLIFHF